MMRKTWLFATVVAATATIAGARVAEAQQAVIWDTGGAVAFGSGCRSVGPNPNTVFVSFGNDAAVLFSAFGVNLPAGSANMALAELKNCEIRIPATLREGFYFSELIQTITYGVNKSANSSGKITTNSSFFNLPVASFTVNVPLGAINNPAVTESQTNPFLVTAACGGAPLSGLFRSGMAVSGSRSSPGQTLILAAQGLDLRYQITIPIVLCPFP